MKGPMIFLCGLVIGVGGSLIYVKKKLIPALTEEIRNEIEAEKSKSNFEKLDWSLTPADLYPYNESEEDEIVVTDPKKKQKPINAKNTDYSKYAKEFEKSVKTDESGENAMELTEIGGTDPYVIDEKSYDEYSSYRSHAFEVYSDGIVFDIEANDVLDADPELIFGKTALKELSDSAEGVVYVRDDSKKHDYKLERMDCPFNGPAEAYVSGDAEDWRE